MKTNEMPNYADQLTDQFDLNRSKVRRYFEHHGEHAIHRLEAFWDIAVNKKEFPVADELQMFLSEATDFLSVNQNALVKTGHSKDEFDGPRFLRRIIEKCFHLDVKRQRASIGISIIKPTDIREKRRHYVGYLIEHLSALPMSYWDEMSDIDADIELALKIGDLSNDDVVAPLVRYESDCLATYPGDSVGGFSDVLMMIARSGPEILHGKYSQLHDVLDGIPLPQRYSQHSLYFQLMDSFSKINEIEDMAAEIVEQEIQNNWFQIVTNFNQHIPIRQNERSSLDNRNNIENKTRKKSLGLYEIRGRILYYGSRKVCRLTPSQQFMYDALLKSGSMSVDDLFTSVKRVQSMKNDGRVKALGEFSTKITAEKIRRNWFAGKDGACLWGTLFKVFQSSNGKEHIDLDFSAHPSKK